MLVAYTFTRINKNDTVLLIVDHQEGLFQLVRDFQPDQYRRAVLAHASIGKIFNLPVIMTSSSDTGAFFSIIQYICGSNRSLTLLL